MKRIQLTSISGRPKQGLGKLPGKLWPFMCFFLGQVKWPLVLFFALEFVSRATYSLSPYFFKELTNTFSAEVVDWNHAVLLGIGLVCVVYVLSGIFGRINTYLFDVCFRPYFRQRIRLQLAEYLHGHGVEYFQDDFAGRLSSKVSQTSAAFSTMLGNLIVPIWGLLVAFLTVLVMLSTAHYALVLVYVAWFVLYVAWVAWRAPAIQAQAKSTVDDGSKVEGLLVDGIANISLVKLFGRNTSEREALVKKSAIYASSIRRYSWTREKFFIGLEVLLTLLAVGLIGTALYGRHQGWLTNGDVVLAITLLPQITGMSFWVSNVSVMFFEDLGTIADGMDTLSKAHSVVDAPAAKPLELTKKTGSGIGFENVTFHYGKKEGGIIDNLNFNIPAGQKVGLVGRSGAGKSTLVNLLLRFYDVEGGRITLGGQDIAGVTQNSLRRNIAMVRQENDLLHRSIAENIAYGKPGASMEEIQLAAQRAKASVFIDGLVDKYGNTAYNAIVGERGVKLSGGQRQRIAIARVVLEDAPVLVLDEATSALDSEVEAAIQEEMETLMQGKTVIAIAHRLSTIQKMDRLIVMEAGRIAEEGTHEELLQSGKHYAKLWSMQSGGFLPN